MTKNWKNLKKNKTTNMKKYRTYLLIFSMAVLFGSCEKVIEPGELPQQDARIVLNSILYTDSLISANISSSKSILSAKAYVFIDNAVCELYEDGVYIQNLINAKKGQYLSTIYAKSNKKYTFKVSAPNYKSIEASTTMLGNIAITSIERYDTTISFYRLIDYGSGQLFLIGSTSYRFRIIDDLSRKNYYSIQPIVEAYDTAGNMIDDIEITASITLNTKTNNFNNVNGQSLTVDINDLTLVNGKEIETDISIYLNGFSDTAEDIGSVKVFLKLYNINEDFYRYKTTLT